MRYLTKTSSDIYKVRIRISKDLIQFFHRKEINKSLNTKIYKLAKGQANKIIHEYEKIKLAYQLKLLQFNEIVTKVDDFNKSVLNQIHFKSTNETKVTYSTALDNFNSYYKNKDISKTRKRANLNILNNIFIHLINKREFVSNTTFKNINKIKEQLQKLPKRNLQRYKDKSIRQLIKMKIPQEHLIVDNTLKNYMKVITLFYNFCIAQKYISVNPCHYVQVNLKTPERNEREPFTRQEVRNLIDIISKECDLNKQVIYNSLIYSGMRVSELYKAKIKQCDTTGLYYFDLTYEGLKLKTKSSYRLIPLHEELLRLNVVELLPKALQKVKLTWASRVINEDIKLKVSKSPKKVLYSLRHTVATELKHKEVNHLIISEILGHSVSGMTMGRYASRYPLKTLKENIDKLQF